MKAIELFDETLDINSTDNYELGIQAGPDGFCFCVLDTLRNKFVLMRAFEPDDNRYYNSASIKDFITRDDFLQQKYKKTRIVLPASKFTVVPAPLFDPAKKDEYFRFNHQADSSEIILSNRNNDPDLYVIYSFPRSMHEIMTGFYPDVHPCSQISTLLDHSVKERRNASGNYIHIHIERDYFNLVIFEGHNFKFCNTFRYRNVSDILYYVLNVFGKLGLEQEETVHLSGMAERYDDLTSAISIYVKTIKFAEPRGNFTFSYVFNDIELHRYLNLFSVFNCG